MRGGFRERVGRGPKSEGQRPPVMAGLGPAIHDNLQAAAPWPFVDTRPKAGHDALKECALFGVSAAPHPAFGHLLPVGTGRRALAIGRRRRDDGFGEARTDPDFASLRPATCSCAILRQRTDFGSTSHAIQNSPCRGRQDLHR
jgi:hypothetical protein